MKDTGKSKLHMVQTDWDELELEIRERRLRRVRLIAIIVGICAAAGFFYYIFMQHKSYKDYSIVNQVERTDTAATHFLEYGGNILKYSNDGASYTDAENKLIWNQTFEMQNPLVSVCESYVAFADRGGKEIYVLDTSGLCGKITVNMPISKMETAAQGMVAVLMEESGTSYLALYDQRGERLVEGAIHAGTGGVPLDIAVSPNGENLGISVLDISSGKAKTTINVYNFGSAGQDKADHLVGTFSYDDTVIPDIVYTGNDKLLAFADHAVYSYVGGGVPKEGAHLAVKDEIMSIFYDRDYFALVFSGGKDESSRRIRIYSTSFKEVEDIHTDSTFVSARFLDNHEISLRGERTCAIYTLGGLKKFECEFDDHIYEIMHAGGYRNYWFIMEGKTVQARMKLFGGAGDET